MTVIFIIMLFFVPSYIIGQTSLTEKESFSNKQSVSQKKSSAEDELECRKPL